MKQPHKHAELIKAWADGAEIEFKNGHGEWNPVHNPPIWSEYCEYRIKPEPKPDVVNMYDLRLRLTFDGDTCKLKNAEVLE